MIKIQHDMQLMICVWNWMDEI